MRPLIFILFWFFYFPLLRVLALLLFWDPRVTERRRFEKRNKFEALAHSFKEKGIAADLCFQFSSEGEFQQVAPLIMDSLKEGKKLELVFFSPSVERAIMRLASEYPKQIRYLRYPVLRLFPFIQRRSFTHWVSSKTLIMVRYDLFPEFLLWGMKSSHKLRIIWMTFKKERVKGKRPSFWKQLFLRHSDKIIFAGKDDLLTAASLGFDGREYDFRLEQIKRRMLARNEKLRSSFALYPDFKHYLESSDTKVILGNAWPSDLFLLRNLPEDVTLVIVPHQLNEEILSLFREGLENIGREVFEINQRTTTFVPSKTILINKKGILCELYADFPFAYVGGGFEGSIHSVLEPLVAGSESIACGPFHHRSTEYDIALDCGRITEVNTPEQFLSWVNQHGKNLDRAKIDSLLQGYEELREFITC